MHYARNCSIFNSRNARTQTHTKMTYDITPATSRSFAVITVANGQATSELVEATTFHAAWQVVFNRVAAANPTAKVSVDFSAPAGQYTPTMFKGTFTTESGTIEVLATA